MAAYIKDNANNHAPLSVCLYACHMCKSEGGLYVNVKLHFLVEYPMAVRMILSLLKLIRTFVLYSKS